MAGTPEAPVRGARVKIEGGDRSFDIFEGGEGEDTIALGDSDTVLFLDDRYSDSPSETHVARISGVEIVEGGAGRNVVDADGGGDNFVTIATFNNLRSLPTVEQLEDNGNLVVV